MTPKIDRALSALIGSAVAGGLVTATGFVAAMVAPAFAFGVPTLAEALSGILLAAVMAGVLAIYTTFVFGAGLFLIGLPAWAVLHRLGRRTRRIAVLAGGALTGATAGALALGLSGPNSNAAIFAALMIIPGGLAGWTLHRIAYGRAGQKLP